MWLFNAFLWTFLPLYIREWISLPSPCWKECYPTIIFLPVCRMFLDFQSQTKLWLQVNPTWSITLNFYFCVIFLNSDFSNFGSQPETEIFETVFQRVVLFLFSRVFIGCSIYFEFSRMTPGKRKVLTPRSLRWCVGHCWLQPTVLECSSEILLFTLVGQRCLIDYSRLRMTTAQLGEEPGG